MGTISSYDSSSISTLFSSIGSSKQNSNMFGLYSSLADYSAIKSGSYGKLLKSYYSIDSDSSSKTKDGSKSEKKEISSSNSTSKDNRKLLATIESDASELTSTAKELYARSDNKIFQTSGGSYNMDTIYDKVSELLENYNSLLASTEKSQASSVVKGKNAMTSIVKMNESALKEAGISINKDTNTLAIDEKAFKAAGGEMAKALFYGTGSFSYSLATQASMLNSYAQAEAAKTNTYTASGSYSNNYDVGSLLSEFF